MTSTPTSQRSETLAGTHKIIGDHKQRVSVPLPQSLAQLQAYAERHFGNHAGLYHHGKYKVHKGHHVDAIVHNDVIVVKRKVGNRGPPAITTHQADYIKHPLKGHGPVGPRREGPMSSGKFEGKSAYHMDYVPHPLEANRGFKPESTWKQSLEPTGQSSYRTHFTPHPLERSLALKPADQDQRPSLPFEGVSSYLNDYIRHNVRPSTAAKVQQRDFVPGTFEGASTYNADFVKHPFDRSKPHHRHDAIRPEARPFDGTTEYNREYLKHPHQHVPVVHLQPSIGIARRNSRMGDSLGFSKSKNPAESSTRPMSVPASVRSA
mmetsp:Transcript_107011/g.209783  ORF Transcript_107011/g.209783 Transcript_107011/m.209783 type:complete len:320 (-) Transcript_107011:115-1074(-)